MNPADLIPPPDAIPVPWGWLQVLLLVTFFLHVLLMNVMLGTAIIAFVRHVRQPETPDLLTRTISNKLPFTIALTVNFGVAPLLFVQVLYGNFIYVSSIMMAALWLSLIGFLICAYYTTYIYRYQYEAIGAGRTVATALISGLLLLTGFLFCANFTLMLHPSAWLEYFSHPAAMLINFADPTLVPRYLHFVLAAPAVGGLAIAIYFQQRQNRGIEDAGPWIRYGCNWFGYATFANFGVGFWFFGSLPKGLINPSTLDGGLFSLCIVFGLVSALLAAIQGLRLQVMPALYLLLCTIFSMVLARELLRVAYLDPWFSLADLKVSPAYSPLFVFLLFFGGGLTLLGWMLRTAYRTYNDKEVRP